MFYCDLRGTKRGPQTSVDTRKSIGGSTCEGSANVCDLLDRDNRSPTVVLYVRDSPAFRFKFFTYAL
jgi:hypothetical protein